MRPPSISEQLYKHALRLISPFTSEGGLTWVVIPTGPLTHQAWPLNSTQFRMWLAGSFQAEHGIFPGDQGLRHAISMIEARISFASGGIGEQQDVFTRIGYRGDPLRPDALSIDLGTRSREVVEIAASGWRINTTHGWRFRESPTSRPLPRPIHDSRIPTLLDALMPLFPEVASPTLHRVVTWLFAALRPSGPYPILILTGPPNSGKSMTARMLRSLIDPAVAPLQTLPQSERELFILALHNRILAFDHVPSLSMGQSAAIARLATGTAFSHPGLNPLDAPLSLSVARPIILTVPSTEAAAAHWSHNHTVSSLSITAQLDFIDPSRRRSHHDIASEFGAASPALLGSLCDAVSAALANINETTVAAPSRFADAHQWTASAALALGLSMQNVSDAFGATPLVRAITSLLAEYGEWTGTSTDLLSALGDLPGVPLNPKSLTQALIGTPLAVFGIDYSTSRSNKERRIKLSVTDAQKHLSLLTRTSVTN